MNKQFFLNHSKIDVYFKQSYDDFIVSEIPLYEFSGQGEHLILKIRKKSLSTWDMIQIISSNVGCKLSDIGYAGLKDKNAMTIQNISIPKRFETKIDLLNERNIKILEKTYHKNKIKIGHLKGNSFFIRFKRVSVLDSYKLDEVLSKIENYGMPNYFGFQRFGLDGNNYLKGKEIIDAKRKEKNKRLRQMYINAYQSYNFNNWLSKRVEISKLINSFKPEEISDTINMSVEDIKHLKSQKHQFKILLGDVMSHYPFGKIFYVSNIDEESEKFNKRDRVPTGLLSGKKTKLAIENARTIEKLYDKQTIVDGSRRFAWVFPTQISNKYNEDKKWYEINFSLPKGSYATELVRELLH